MSDNKRFIYAVTLPNRAKAEMLRTVLAYEGAARGLPMGQALAELVFEAAEPSCYPEGLRDMCVEFEGRLLEEVKGCMSGYVDLVRSA